MKNVYFFCRHAVPTGHPNGIRIANLGLIFKELGYKVHLIGCDNKETRVFQYKGMKCKVFNQKETTGLYSALQREKDRYTYVKNYFLENGDPTIIITALQNCRAQRYLLNYSKKKNIKIIASICEWFDKNNFIGIKGFFKLINNRYTMYKQIPRIKNVICISSLLCNFYSGKRCNTIYIPTIVDENDYLGLQKNSIVSDNKIKISYAGSPAKKDYIINVIYAIQLLSETECSRIEIHLYGITEEQLLQLGVKEAYLKKYTNIICHGKIPYEQIKLKIVDSDFTVLLRPNKRYANAGFPTKVGESMACGTPVIANITSDLDKYIIDKETGIICSDESSNSCAEAFRRVIDLNRNDINYMNEQTRKMTEKSFYYTNYILEMSDFLNK